MMSDTLSSIYNFLGCQPDEKKQIKQTNLRFLRTSDENNLIANKLMCERT